MDVQKVAAQSAANTQQQGQRKNDDAPKAVETFLDMIRSPTTVLTPAIDPFMGHMDDANSAADTGPEPKSPPQQDDQKRVDNSANERRTDNRDSTPHESRNDDKNTAHNDGDKTDHTKKSREDDHDDKAAKAGSEDNPTKKSSANRNDDDASSTETVDRKPPGPLKDDADANDEQKGIEVALAPALQDLHAATQAHDGSKVAESPHALASATAGQKQGKDDQHAQAQVQQQNQGANPSLAKGTEAANPKARVGTPTPGNDQAQQAASNNGQPSLTDQQAQALAAQLKLDKPAKVQVRVTDRGTAKAAEATQGKFQTPDTQTDVTRAASSKLGTDSQPALPRVNGAANAQAHVANQATVAQNQGQVQAQLANSVTNSMADSGLGRASNPLASNGVQAASGIDASGATGQATGQTQQASDPQRTAQAQQAKPSAPARPVMHQISVNITKAIAEGLDKITIHLRPEELGRVEVRLEVDDHGKVKAHVIADKPDTLNMLRNDARSLEKALQNAGFDTGSGDLSFDLRNQEQNSDGEKSGSAVSSRGRIDDSGDTEAKLAQMILNGEPLSIISKDRVDIRA